MGTPLIDRIKARNKPCEACGSDDPRPVTHKTWCSVRILEPSLHRREADLRLTVENGEERTVNESTDYFCDECSTGEVEIWHEAAR